MEQHLPEFDAAGIRVVAVSVDEPEVSRDLARAKGYSFTVLSDPEMKVIGRYDLVDPVEQVARPAEFLIDSMGIVRWKNLAPSVYVRARPDAVLEAASALK
jgi:mycoredoxin-dependent peroxiredoxin